MTEQHVVTLPRATAKRIPLYYRYLCMYRAEGVTRIKSHELSKSIHIPAATIRRDFSCFGELGKSGYGYDVSHLIDTFARMLRVDELHKIALLGVGNLGRALIQNNFRRNDNLRITCGFDNQCPEIDTIINGVPIYHMDQLAEKIREQGITTAISTVPSVHAQEAVAQLTEAGVRSILNFAPARLKVPEGVHVKYIDLTSEIQTLMYFADAENTQNNMEEAIATFAEPE
ncbi:redox-sensing transcriptional repressor Rex [Schleiferilactobacillus harbinensis]|uniref:redox-sensing transcriptional repressor Rex n=1 Tax=Schleiferilactobacillus harbinensis TaxID=304207 RepID=UPI0021A851A4|nr:redox-sensing transcriptional repressor Rex [Schleiferilactobacillus harbinensis]MCT2907113.1 redox-sensing transcriptional repressor Rex [Schleiferilactobacillus harbinensis]